MENLYKELRSFFANDMDLNDLFDSEAIIWIDWREYDEDVVNYFNDMMDEPIDIQTVSNGKPYGDDIVLQKGDKELQIPYGDEQDRDVPSNILTISFSLIMRCVGLLKVLETIRSALPCFQCQNGPN